MHPTPLLLHEPENQWIDLNIKAWPVFIKNYQSKKRVILNRGGTSSSKTGSLIDIAINWLFTGHVDDDRYFETGIFSIVRKYSANLRTSVQRDFEEHLHNLGVWDYVQVAKSEKTYKYWGRTIEFLGIDDPQKARWPRRDILWCNEWNELTYEDYFQLSIRTNYKIFIDFNPDDEDIWINTELEQKRRIEEDDVEVIVSTYKDNPFLNPIIQKEIARLEMTDATYWKIYGLWEYGRLEGIIFNFIEIEEVPEEAKLADYWQDFGFNDPATLVGVYSWNWWIVLDEEFYETWLLNSDIIKKYDSIGIEKSKEIFGDSSEPKTIAEIHKAGYNIKPAVKGADSIKFGIDTMKGYTLYVTKRSANLKKELKKYIWLKDKSGKSLDVPIDAFNHAIDAARYWIVMKFAKIHHKKRVRVHSLSTSIWQEEQSQ